MAGSRIRIVDRGYRAYMHRVSKMRRSRAGVEVGVIGSEGSYEDSTTVVQVATWAEFGIGQPQRSWLRGFIDENRADLNRQLRDTARLALRIGPELALERLGLKIAADIKKRIVGGIAPPNADSTIARKGSSTPLINTAQFLNSIQHKVING